MTCRSTTGAADTAILAACRWACVCGDASGTEKVSQRFDLRRVTSCLRKRQVAWRARSRDGIPWFLSLRVLCSGRMRTRTSSSSTSTGRVSTHDLDGRPACIIVDASGMGKVVDTAGIKIPAVSILFAVQLTSSVARKPSTWYTY